MQRILVTAPLLEKQSGLQLRPSSMSAFQEGCMEFRRIAIYVLLAVSVVTAPLSVNAATGTTFKTVSAAPGNWVISSNLEIPANVKLKVQSGATISVASGKTLTIHGVLEAPLAKIFTGSGEVVFDTDFAQVVYPQWWGAKGDGVTEDTYPVQAAINSFTEKGGEIFLTDGTYMVGNVGMKSNITLRGKGTTSILKQKYGSDYCIDTNPTNTRINKTRNYTLNPSKIKYSGITFRGTVDTDGFSEHVHLMQVEAATQVSIDNCSFIGFRGDGIYLGEGPNKSHNSKVSITKSVFNGINRNNRNGISVIDCDGLLVQDCTFSNCTQSNMPGAIDIEPNFSYNIVKNIKIDRNKFNNIGGTNIQFYNPPKTKLDTSTSNIEITNNIIDGDGSSQGIYVGVTMSADNVTASTNVLISNNTVRNTDRAFMVFGLKRLIMQGNVFDGCKRASGISDPDGKSNLMDVSLLANTFKNLSQVDGIGLYVSGVENLEIKQNIFDNIGKSDGSGGNALYFSNKGNSAKHVTIINNTFKGDNTTVAIQRQAGNVTFPELNTISGNEVGSKKIYLPAQ
jgi:hypothetical protein